MPKVSICVPIHDMENADYFLTRNLYSIAQQNFKNYEIVISDDSGGKLNSVLGQYSNYPIKYVENPQMKGMANNTNNAMNHASGDLVKILFMDDYFYDIDSLDEMVKHFTPNTTWMATSCVHSLDGVNIFNKHIPYFSESENTIGSPSVTMFHKSVKERFDNNFDWVLDLDLYKRLYRAYGKPKIHDKVAVVIGIGLHQMTAILSDQQKQKEFKLLKVKYEQATAE